MALGYCQNHKTSGNFLVPVQCTEVRFASFLSCEFITTIVLNPMEWKLAKRTSVHCTGCSSENTWALVWTGPKIWKPFSIFLQNSTTNSAQIHPNDAGFAVIQTYRKWNIQTCGCFKTSCCFLVLYNEQSWYRGSPLSMISLSTIPGIVQIPRYSMFFLLFFSKKHDH